MWTAGVETRFMDGLSLPRELGSLISDELVGRGANFGINSKGRARIHFGVNGESKQVASDESEALVKQALGNIGVGWLEVSCLSITHNVLIDDAISRIDNEGNLKPEGGPLTHPQNN